MKIGIDLGGSHIALGVLVNEKIIQKLEYDFSIEDKKNFECVINRFIRSGLDKVLNKQSGKEIEMIGISVPGRPQNGYIKGACNIKEDINIVKMVRSVIDKPIYVMNDGICAGIAEKEYGNLKESTNGVFLGFGTGIGTAVFLNNKLVPEVKSAGHMIIERDGRRCNCGKKGCYEAYASMQVFKNSIKKILKKEELTSKEILELLKNTDQEDNIKKFIKEYIEYAAIGIVNFATICSADKLVIGGSFVYFKDILFNKLLDEINKIMLPNEKEIIKIELAKFKNDAGIVGATKIDKYIKKSIVT